MRILIADDDPGSRRLLESTLTKWGYEVVVTSDGQQAWQLIQTGDPPPLFILDWLMPGMDGVEVCRKARAQKNVRSAYIILLTSRSSKEDLVAGLEAGADDYLTKPFDPQELQARLHVGSRVIELQRALASRVKELEAALSREKHLRGLLPICCYCKKIRDDSNYWHQVESYVTQHADVHFSHSVCPECTDQFRKDLGLVD
jgi:DNA-binding response OmpR family regulator